MKVKRISKVVGRLEIRDPFIFAAYHYDKFPEGNGKMAPKSYLAGRQIGSDFNQNAPWRMYHGDKVPGFPQHPHRGFEIATIVTEGMVDHFDSKGSKGRYGNGDVQLMSAGSGIMHSEMFPLVNEDKENTLRLFQIWMNLPAKNKMTEPDYKMLWRNDVPVVSVKSPLGGYVRFKVILGEYYGVKAPHVLKYSWAQDENNHMGIALIEMEPNTEFKLAGVSRSMNRFLFYYDGNESVKIDDTELEVNFMADLYGDQELTIKNGDSPSKLFLLEGEPINEPVAAYGPFVMSNRKELEEAFNEFRETQFGGWPWGEEEADIVFGKDVGRFASYQFDKLVDKPEE